MFDPQTFAASQIAGDFAFEGTIDATPKKAQYLGAFTHQHSVLEQAGVKLRKGVGVTKHNIGGYFNFLEAPVIAVWEFPFRVLCYRIDRFDNGIKVIGELTLH